VSAQPIRENKLARRVERAQLVRRLYDESSLPPHKRRTAIGRQTGLSRGYVHELLKDPAGTEASKRRTKYYGRCKDCGARTNSGGLDIPERCLACSKARQEAAAIWTPETIIRAIQGWAEAHRRPPRPTDWIRGGPGHPPMSRVVHKIGWAKALKAAGFEPRWQGPGAVAHVTQDVLDETVAAYEMHGTLARTGEALGITGQAVRLRLLKAGIKPRSVRRHTVPRLKPEDMAERQVSQLQARKERLEVEIETIEQEIAKWEAVKDAMESVNGAVAA
jgi:hypothetical protein